MADPMTSARAETLHALVLPLSGPDRPSPRHAQSWLYRQLEPIHPELHDPSGPKPFTVGVGGKDPPYLRFTFLSAQVHAALEPTFACLTDLMLGGQLYRVRTVLTQGHPWAGQSSYAALMELPPSPDAPLHFASLTFFRRQGTNYPLPEPKLVFGSLAERWNAFAPTPLPDDILMEMTDRLTLRHFRLQSRSATMLGSERTVGCLGRATYHLPQATPHEARWLTTLSHFAFYSGVGAKTTLGFGQTSPRSAKDPTP